MKKRLTFQRIYGTNVRHIASDNNPFILNVSKRIIKPNAITPISKIIYPKTSTLATEKNIPSLSTLCRLYTLHIIRVNTAKIPNHKYIYNGSSYLK